MRFSCSFLFMITFMVIGMPAWAAISFNNVAFYYGTTSPIDELKAFDLVVVEPRNFDIKKTEKKKFFAYVSVGEVQSNRSYYPSISKDWIVGKNLIWKSEILDQSNPAWQRFFVNQIITPLWEKGFHGFFFDTMDSYQIAAKTEEEREKQQKGLIGIIQQVKEKYPEANIILNRGFELISKVHENIDAVAAEDLFQQFNPEKNRYEVVTERNRRWLFNQLKKVTAYKIPVIVIDYVAPNNRRLARQIAKKIDRLGFIPYVSDGLLQTIGVSNIEVLPRKILMIYDDKESEGVYFSPALRYAAMPLEYLGYIPVFIDIHQNTLPQDPLTGQYAGIVSWIENSHISNSEPIQKWFIKQKASGVPIAILGLLEHTLTPQFKKSFGLKIIESEELPASVKITKRSSLIGFESDPHPNIYEFTKIEAKNSKIQLQLKDNLGEISQPVAITSWGGYALSPFIVTLLPNDEVRWVIDPFQFFTQAFKLTLYPIPDTTTENGRRLLMVHIDGDASISQAEWYEGPLAAQVMLDEILKVYTLPTTVSVITGEITPDGAYPKTSKEGIKIFKEMLKLPWIEPASHTYSHPFYWQKTKFVSDKFVESLQDSFLPIKNYKFNLKKEIVGSVNYINNNLLPEGKSCKILFWSGDCNPYEAAVGMTYDNQLLNMNGGGATITKSSNSITNISGLGVYKGKYLQIFAPNQNENVYTGLWTGPFYGYERVVETFELTNSPKRFKPIDIYYHFYSATKKASLKALKYVYDWTMKQSFMSIYASSYIKKAVDFYHITIAKSVTKKEVEYLIDNNGDLREFRLPKKYGYPNLKKSKNIIGFSTYQDDYYLHTGSSKRTSLVLNKKAPKDPYLVEANGRIESFEVNSKGISFSVKSYQPLEFTVKNVKTCQLKSGKGKLYQRPESDYNIRYYMTRRASDVIGIECQK